MGLIVVKTTNAVIGKALLPHREAGFEAKRKSSLDELHGALQREVRGGRNQEMNVVKHDDEFVEKIFLGVAIMEEGFDEEIGGWRMTEERTTIRGDGRDEESAVVHGLDGYAWKRCGSVSGVTD